MEVLATRIIPTILSKNGQLVKGEAFKCDRVVGNALQASRIHAMRGVDEVMLLDVTATKEEREPDYEMVKKLSETMYTPLTVGGGVKTEHHVRELLNAGADKVCIGTAYLYNPELITELSSKFGRQCITVSMDVRDKERSPYVSIAAEMLERAGAGEILLQSVDRDGTMEGYDIDLIKSVSEAVSIPVIASGGCSGYEDMYQAIQAGASAVAAGALFQFTDCTPKGAAKYLKAKGVEVRD
jgi:cyclase